jgi:hypothetical protein
VTFNLGALTRVEFSKFKNTGEKSRSRTWKSDFFSSIFKNSGEKVRAEQTPVLEVNHRSVCQIMLVYIEVA